MKTFLLICLVALGLLFQSCLHPKEPAAPQLPPETQTGANTFGCYVNGQLWLPKGSVSAGGSNFSIGYDPALSKGFLTISALQRPNPSHFERIGIVIDSARSSTLYTYKKWNGTDTLLLRVSYENQTTNCEIRSVDSNREPDIYCAGKVKISKLSLEERVIAGTFEFTLYKPGCDTIKVTQGRFDKKL